MRNSSCGCKAAVCMAFIGSAPISFIQPISAKQTYHREIELEVAAIMVNESYMRGCPIDHARVVVSAARATLRDPD